MIDYDLLNKLNNPGQSDSINTTDPKLLAILNMPAWKYALIVCSLQFAYPFLFCVVLFILHLVFD